jgi:hypothetical protein
VHAITTQIDTDTFVIAIGFTPIGSSTVHIYTQTINRTTKLFWEESGLCPVFATYTLSFGLQLRKKHGETSVRVDKRINIHKRNNTITQ